MAYEDFKDGCEVIKEFVNDKNKETADKIPTKVSELTNDSKFATEEYVDDKIADISQPTSLPQTYTKKEVTLANSGWVAVSPYLIKNQNFTTQQTYYGNYAKYRTATAAADWKFSSNYSDLTYISSVTAETEYLHIETSGNSIYTPTWDVKIYDDKMIVSQGGRGGGSSTMSLQCIKAGITDFAYTLTDTDVKLNSEVRFTLDEASGKNAADVGLQQSITKENGKLTFTANTQPSVDLKGTLEIGETSTEGAAFVVGKAPTVFSPDWLPQENNVSPDITIPTTLWTAVEVDGKTVYRAQHTTPLYAGRNAEIRFILDTESIQAASRAGLHREIERSTEAHEGGNYYPVFTADKKPQDDIKGAWLTDYTRYADTARVVGLETTLNSNNTFSGENTFEKGITAQSVKEVGGDAYLEMDEDDNVNLGSHFAPLILKANNASIAFSYRFLGQVYTKKVAFQDQIPSLSQANVFFYAGKYEGYPVCHVHTTTFTYNNGTGFNRSICTLAEWEAMGLPSPADKTYTLEVNNLQGFKDGTYQKITEAMTFSLILSSVDVGGVATQYVNLHWNLTDSTSSTFEVEADIVLMHN